jgi:hypothetical protein
MQGTALCLSGGGIRSASFSLGNPAGLARISRRRDTVAIRWPAWSPQLA